MPITNPNPGSYRKDVFKVYSGKLPYSQNTQEGCALCHIRRGPGEKPLSICAGCRSIRLCSREHQTEFWPRHKDFCRQQAKVLKELDELQQTLPDSTDGLPYLPERKVIVEDWLDLHYHSIEEALTSLVYTADPPVGFANQFADFDLEYCVDSGGNPATAYTPRSVKLSTEPDPSPFAVFRGMVNDANAQDQAKMGYLGYLLFQYNGKIMPVLTAIAIFKEYLRPISIAEHLDWFSPLQQTVNQGVAYRVIGPKEREWTPGLVERLDDKHWIWRPKTPEELVDEGIRLPEITY